MIKRIVTVLLFMIIMAVPVFSADVIPTYSNNLMDNSFGLYQASKLIVLHEKPSENSKIVQTISWTEDKIMPENLSPNDIFAIYVSSKNLALLEVVDEDEDWVCVVYNRKSHKSAWMKKDDPYKFMTWVNFYNSYGKKYGLYFLKDSKPPKSRQELYSAPEETAQVVSHLNRPEFIKLNVIRGNWALVTVVDLDRQPKTGYIRWRSDDGSKLLFPAIK